MIYNLIKASSPSWEKWFATPAELTEELRSHICMECLDELHWQHSKDKKVFVESSLKDLLNTPCGCEFWYEEIT